MVEVDSDVVEGEWPDQQRWFDAAETAVRAALAGDGHQNALSSPDLQVEISVRLTNDEEVRRLNRDYRGKDKPTNILSFPMLEPDEARQLLAAGAGDILLGDLAIAEETLLAEAAGKGIAALDHFIHLVVHGTLHLVGHDHQQDAEAETMEQLETRILAGLGIADPYAEPSAPHVSGIS